MTQSEERQLLLSSRSRRPRRRINWLRLGLLFAFGAAVAIGASWGWNHPEPSLPGVKPGTTGAATPQFTVLLMGVDDRPGEPGRSDTMLLASVDLAAKKLRMISIPRDSWAHIPGHGWDKLNHAYAFGGEEPAQKAALAQKAVEGLLGLPIDHYVVVNMQGFRRIVDVLGGVTIDVEKNMKYDDPQDTPPLHIDLHAGVQRLDGEHALQYARFRHDEDSDWGRMKREQEVIKALVTEALQPRNLTKLPSLVTEVHRAVNTDLSLLQALQLARLAKQEAQGENVESKTILGRDRYIDNIYYLQLDLLEARQTAYRFLLAKDPDPEFVYQAEKDAKAYRQAIEAYAARFPAPQGGTPAANGSGGTPAANGTAGGTGTGATNQPPSSNAVPVTILDASGKGLGAKYAAIFTGKGYQVGTIARSQSTLPSTQVILHGAATALAKDLASLMPRARIVVDTRAGQKTAVDVILGSDLAS